MYNRYNIVIVVHCSNVQCLYNYMLCCAQNNYPSAWRVSSDFCGHMLKIEIDIVTGGGVPP